MQLMIDTNTDDATTIRKAVAMLQAYLGDSVTPSKVNAVPEAPKAPVVSEVVVPFVKPTEAPMPQAPAPVAEISPPKLSEVPSPPPLIPSAPIVTAASVTAPPSSPSPLPAEYDSAGIPWDARIHQSAKGKKKDLTWKLQKGIDPLIVQGVISELSANGKLKQADAFPAAPQAPSAPSNATAAFASNGIGRAPLPAGAEAPPFIPSPPQAPSPPVAPSPPAPPAPPSDAQPGSEFRTLVGRFAAATKAGHLTPAGVNALCAANGAPNIMALNSMVHLIPAVSAALDAELMSRGIAL